MGALHTKLDLLPLGCDLGTGNTPGGTEQGDEKEWEQEGEKEYDWTAAIDQLHDVRAVTAGQIIQDNSDMFVRDTITSTAVQVAGEVDDMRRNVLIYTNLPKYHGAAEGMPSTEFFDSILNFNAYAFVHGHDGMTKYNLTEFCDMTDLIVNLDSMVKDEDKTLFKAYIMALRSINFISARHQVTNDYTTPISLSKGSTTTIGDLLQNINDLNDAGTDYQVTGTYPTTAHLHAAAAALLPNSDNAYPSLIKDVITGMGNMEQLLGRLERAWSLGFEITFEQEATHAIFEATQGETTAIKSNNGWPFSTSVLCEDIYIDKPEYYTN